MSVQNRLLKYGVAGATSYAALEYLTNATNVQLFGRTVPLPVAALGLGVAGSMANDFVHQWILPMLPISDKLEKFEGIAVSLGSGAASTLGLVYLADPALVEELGANKLLMVGAGTEIVSEYAYQQLSMMLGYKQSELVM